jgi:excisionase family DNA binding protein
MGVSFSLTLQGLSMMSAGAFDCQHVIAKRRLTHMNSTDLKITQPDLTARVTISVEEAAKVLGIGRSAAYDAVHRGEIPHIRIGRRYLIPVPRLLTILGADGDA